MAETPTDIRPCWIDRDGIVWSHHCDHKATPATAIPNERLAEVRAAGKDVLKAIREKCSDYNDKVHPYNDDHHIEVTLTIGEIKRFHAALTLLGDTP